MLSIYSVKDFPGLKRQNKRKIEFTDV